MLKVDVGGSLNPQSGFIFSATMQLFWFGAFLNRCFFRKRVMRGVCRRTQPFAYVKCKDQRWKFHIQDFSSIVFISVLLFRDGNNHRGAKKCSFATSVSKQWSSLHDLFSFLLLLEDAAVVALLKILLSHIKVMRAGGKSWSAWHFRVRWWKGAARFLVSKSRCDFC